MHHVRDGEHGARSAAQVIAIGLSRARRAGVSAQAARARHHEVPDPAGGCART
jgi:hypothetical protein